MRLIADPRFPGYAGIKTFNRFGESIVRILYYQLGCAYTLKWLSDNDAGCLGGAEGRQESLRRCEGYVTLPCILDARNSCDYRIRVAYNRPIYYLGKISQSHKNTPIIRCRSGSLPTLILR